MQEYKRKMTEARFQSEILTPWFKKNGWTCAYEAKVSSGNTIPFSKFQPQQLPALYKVKHGILHHKISDMDVNLKPFDGFCMNKEKAYVIALFNKDKKAGRKKFYLLDIDEVMKIKNSGAKSLKIGDFELLGVTIETTIV
uniref:Uncharacterized protein n=1 Tax=viral metagenome TaxID=1070528 RepID=A0A6M3IKQ9_9ZZZZ